MKKILIPILSLTFFGCGEDTLPKPKAFLRLEYPKPQYKRANIPVPFSFEKNELAKPISKIKTTENGNSYSVDIEYPKLKGTVYLTYKKVTKDNLKELLRDAQNLTQKHTQKADEIVSDLFSNPEKRVYGMFYEVGGNAASQSQFYATDSTNHFLSGSLYFYAKPNYDSIYPAAIYLRNDIKRVMESLEWKNLK
ncbi:MAG: gliding motility lipoprotein GldD [Winogradskyella sp.]|uniref:gliding motility lipoprotein GldD n=1 Tax=Winogradskyella sp. TaxID=1883156 RepID=UPI0017F13541|nr:gliding motility lipoprotein GldD [Winogradskyella sp.]MBT8245781.1 gliding motility lipoprotein GldD [Winogradskyella sp.]NNK23351.1 gliding motility lipoprotein GldD [Winogradskyella sp.]